MNNFGCQSMVDEMRFVVLKHPQDSHIDQNTIDAQWQDLGYLERPDFAKVLDEYAAFVDLLQKFDLEMGYLPRHPQTGLDAIYTHDPLVVSNKGVVLCNMGKAARQGESTAWDAYLAQINVPILGRIEAPGTLEGGDVLWLDERTVAVGEGYRSNAAGIRQLQALLGNAVEQVIAVPLPHWTGPDDCLHLLSFISPVDHKKAVVYSRLMPVPFRQWLLAHAWQLIEVPDAEYETMATNVLAVRPGQCIMLAGNPVTQHRLAQAGIEVWTYPGGDLCIKGGGGPTCLTRPIWRATS